MIGWSAAPLTPFLVFLLFPLTRKDQYGVSAQLYTNFDMLAKVMGLPTNDIDTPNSNPLKKKMTCLAKIPENFDDDRNYPYGMEGWDYYRTDPDGNFNNKYFCANVPNPKIDFSKLDTRADRNVTTKTAGIRGPHTLFWLNEPTSWHWHWRWTSSGEDRGFINMVSKKMGLIFVIQATGIKSKGRFLKGWFHLKITLDLDHNMDLDANPPLTPDQKWKAYDKRLSSFEVDKLMVTARGRTLMPGRPRTKDQTDLAEFWPPRRAWVGGVGEFVKDFPPCKEKGYNKNYVPQQFMDCATVTYNEPLHGNNFYYTRTENDANTKYGQTHNGATGRMEIHLNFKLDNSLCNNYYDLDFIANGIVRNNEISEVDYPAKDFTKRPKHKYLFYNVQRSISTRFVFASSHGAHFPTFYENADPIPRGVANVVCSEPLVAEWEMNDDPKLKETKAQLPTKHRVAVTSGADLKLTRNGVPSPDASFGGVIKFIYDVPSNMYDFKPPTRKTDDEWDYYPGFTAHRTFTYQDKLLVTINRISFFHEQKRDENSPYIDLWDKYEPIKPTANTDPVKYSKDVRRNMILSIQRVLNEFDWETWLANAKDAPVCSDVFAKKDPDLGNLKSEMKNWPHPYYDATCTLITAQHPSGTDVNTDATYYRAYVERGIRSWTTLTPNSLFRTIPVSRGRCKGGLWFFNGGQARPCDFFFQASKTNKTKDPALKLIVTMTDTQIDKGSRVKWSTKYMKMTVNRRFQCLISNKLREAFPTCPNLKPRPYTERPINASKQDIEELEAEKKWKANENKISRNSKSYLRGILAAEDPFTLYIWDSRLIHGIFMTVITMCVTPISIFMTRYFKETFMDSRIFLHRIWFFIHISASFVTALLFLVGLWRQTESRGILGVSLSRSALAHRIMGWISVTICLLLVFFGAFRCMDKIMRAVIIVMHSVMGILFYILCLTCMITANAIPGSPAAYNDFSVNNFSGANLEKEGVLMTVIIWIIFDIGMHTTMTIMQCIHDKNMKLTSPRLILVTPMPVLLETERFDAPGRFGRIYMLTAYIAVSIASTIAISTLILSHSPRHKGLGFMSCTHQFSNNAVRNTYDC